MMLLATGKEFQFDSPDFEVDKLILSATALIPTGAQDCDLESCNPQSALGAKLSAINIIQNYVSKIIIADSKHIDLLVDLILTHIFYNEGLFERKIESTFAILEGSDSLTSSRVNEPAFKGILIPVFKILNSIMKYLSDGSSFEILLKTIPPSLISSMVPLLMSPIHGERVYLLNIFESAILCLNEEYSTALLSAIENYIYMLVERNLPLREVNGILRLLVVCNVRMPKLFLELVHSTIFPLYRHPKFYMISENYAFIIELALNRYIEIQ